jgi:hypothetical protein
MSKTTDIMRYYALLLFFSGLFLQAAPGQPQGGGNRIDERIQAMKAAFITDRLRLTPEEAQQFWPLYNQFEEAERELRQAYRPERPIEEMSDAEAMEFLNRHLEMEEKLIDLRRRYIGRFQEVLPARKVALLRKVEEEFKRELLRRMREMRRRQ